MEASYRFFRNTACPYFPCHRGIEPEEFNCLFCYCPLYFWGEACGGDCCRTAGLKDCSHCLLPHQPQGYDHIQEKLQLWFARQRQKTE